MGRYKFSIGALFLSVIFLGTGLALGLNIEYMWFSRFGALVVLCGVISEYSLLQLELSTLYSALKGQGAAEFGNTGISD